ncbi:MAG: hypothetical protein F4139_06760 [Gemmatimonadetes bacterium]|nr:hypothetical protein [Gemmatimonadota bacterium]MYB99265.1 hypothetical protein [Gemmatimonadota bacterium]MYH52637.1 hypothetical protein [Gemmatimonadota bacterium]MYI47317.1 hypothetical protein [Gemmatimonadota bacterium]MYK67631.1 hypothetical protein [Gemmatimonadota bacterium]
MTDFQWVAESAPLPGFVIRATVVLATGIALAWLMRKRSAQVRHGLWTATLLLLLLLPALTFWAPQWEMPLLPVATRPAAEAEARGLPLTSPVTTEAEAMGLPSTSPGEFAAASASRAAATTPQRSEVTLTASESSDLAGKAAVVPTRDVAAAPATGPDPESASARHAKFDHGSMPPTGSASEPAAPRDVGPIVPSGPRAQLLLLWAIGSLGGLVSLAVGHLRFRTLVRRAHPIDDSLWIRDLRAVGSRLGLRREVRLLVSETAGTPMTGGFRKPVILLPASSATWEPERRTVVLMHEVVHVRRGDALRQLLSGIVLSLYWFHPLSWVASRLAAASREEACDERVLELGSRPSEYARHLMSLATETTSARLPVAALSMARQSPSRLERRIMAILRPRRARTSALVSGALLTVTGLLGLSAAIAHPVPREQAGAPAIRAHQPSSQEIGEENPAPAVAAADRQPEAQASGYTAEETAESAGRGPAKPEMEDGGNGKPGPDIGDGASITGAVDRGRSVVSDAPGIVTAGYDLAAPPPVDLQEMSCWPPSAGREETGDTVQGGTPVPAFNVGTVPIGVVWKGEDRFAVTSVERVLLCMRLHGEVHLGSGGIPTIAEDGWILLESEGEKLHRLILRPVTRPPGEVGIEHWWSVGHENRPFDERARQWRDGMLTVLRGLMEIDRIHHEKSALERRISQRLGAVPGLEDQAASDRGVVAGLQRQVAYHQSVVTDLLDEISYHQEVLSGMRGEIAYHRDVVSGMRAEIVMHRARVAAFQEVKATYEAEITAIIPRLKTASSSERESIDRSIKAWEERIKGIEAQISAYGLYGKVRKVEDWIKNYTLDRRVRTIEDQIAAYEDYAGLQKIDAEIAEETARLDEVTRRADQAVMARALRIRDTGKDAAAPAATEVEIARLDEIARLEQELRDLNADGLMEMIRQSVEQARKDLLELIRTL